MRVASPDRSKTVEGEHITFLGIAPMKALEDRHSADRRFAHSVIEMRNCDSAPVVVELQSNSLMGVNPN
jgi:hypothetical protein